MIYLVDHFLGVEYDTKSPIVITDGSTRDNIRNHCIARGWITRDAFLPHMQRTTLKVRMSIEKVLSDSAQILPSALEELDCKTTSWILTPTNGTTRTTVSDQSSEPKMLP